MSSQVWAICLAKDENEILPFTVRHLFSEGVDGIIVADNNSTDGQYETLAAMRVEFPTLHVIRDEEIAFRQSQKLTQLANLAYEQYGADWIIPFDADELHYSLMDMNLANTLRLASTTVASISMLNYFATGRDDTSEPNPFEREQWRKVGENPLNKVAFRWSPNLEVAAGFHSIIRNGRQEVGTGCSVRIAHFQNRSPEHLIRKIRNEERGYAAAPELSKGIGYWWKFGALTNEQIRDWWEREYYFPDPVVAGLVFDPAPYMKHATISEPVQ